MPFIENVEFDEFIARRGAAGRSELAGALRVLARRQSPELAARLEGSPDEVLLEPRAFSLFSQTEARLSLPQLLHGRLPRAERPMEAAVESDARGVVCVPGAGWFRTDRRATVLLLRYDPGTDAWSLHDDVGPVAAELVPALRVPGTGVELVREADPLLASCLRHGVSPDHEPVLVDPEPHVAPIAEALSVIRACAPRFHAELLTGLRAIVLFRHPDANSFAALAAHGAVFLNVRWPASVAYFVDELSHQGGHVVFTAATVKRQDFFCMHPDTPLSDLTGEDDSRPLYDALHGVYTEHVCSRAMRAADERRLLRGPEAVELYGRLAFVSGRYGIDVALQAATLERWASPLGRELHAFFADDCARLHRQRPDLRRLDLSAQPYEFDAAVFARQNPHVTSTTFDHLHGPAPAGNAPSHREYLR